MNKTVTILALSIAFFMSLALIILWALNGLLMAGGTDLHFDYSMLNIFYVFILLTAFHAKLSINVDR